MGGSTGTWIGVVSVLLSVHGASAVSAQVATAVLTIDVSEVMAVDTVTTTVSGSVVAPTASGTE